jgi:PilZ domain
MDQEQSPHARYTELPYGHDSIHDVADRRRNTRFVSGMPVKCRFADGKLAQTFLGEVVNISSRGVLLKGTADGLSAGRKVTACIDWPAHLDNRVQLQLVVIGRVVRRTEDCTALQIETYEFRTRAGKSIGKKLAAAIPARQP